MKRKIFISSKHQLHPRDIETLGEFLGEDSDLPLLTRQEERELLWIVEENCGLVELVNALAEEGCIITDAEVKANCTAWAKAREELVKRNLRLVGAIAKPFVSIVGDTNFADLLQDGAYGLMAAIDKFRKVFNVRLATYATWWIWRDLKQSALKYSGLTSRDAQLVAKFKRIQHELKVLLEREPSYQEIAYHFGQKTELVLEIAGLARLTVSLNSPVGTENGEVVELCQLIPEDGYPSVLDGIVDASLREFVLARVDRLRDYERDVIMMRFGLNRSEPMTLKQIADHFGKTRERIRQVESLALERLLKDEELALVPED